MKGNEIMRFFLYFTLLSIIFIMSTGISLALIQQNSFVGAWLFDEGGGQNVTDLTNKNGIGKAFGGPKWVQGKSGTAIDFDGKDDYLEIKLPEVFNNMAKNDFTITYWANIQDIKGSGDVWKRIVEARFDNTNYLQFDIQINDGELGINVIVEGIETTFITDLPIVADTWYYVTCTWEASKKSLKFYLDGVLQTKPGTTPASAGTQKILNIGRRSDDNPSTYFDGIIDEFAVLNVALSEEDIKALMNNGLNTYASVSPLDKLANTWSKIKLSDVTEKR
jgi:hypothetical protein